MLNEKFAFCFEMIIRWTETNLHGTRVKSTKCKTHVIKDYLLKLMSWINLMVYHMMKLSLVIKNFQS